MTKKEVLNNLKAGDYIAFEVKEIYDEPIIIVESISIAQRKKVFIEFLILHSDASKWIDKKDIIAVSDPNSTGVINGYRGAFNILKPEHKLLNK